MTTNFPILRLPQVAFSSVINVADPSELVMLALCSKRAFYLVKSYRKKFKKEEMHFDFEYPSASIYFSISKERHELIWVLEEGYHPGWDCDGPLRNESIVKVNSIKDDSWVVDCALSCKSPRDGLIWTIHWLTELFRSDVIRLFLGKSEIDWIGYIQNWEKTMVSVILEDEESMIPEEDYKKILDCKAQEVVLRTRLNTRTFEYPGMLPKRDALILTNAYWFTSSHLMESDYKHLAVEGSQLTEWDLNQFIKQWVMGRKKNLRALAIDMNEEINFDVVFDGLQEKCHRLPKKQNLEYITPASIIFKFENMEIYIERDDGTFGAVYWRRYRFYLIFPDDFNNTIQQMIE